MIRKSLLLMTVLSILSARAESSSPVPTEAQPILDAYRERRAEWVGDGGQATDGTRLWYFNVRDGKNSPGHTRITVPVGCPPEQFLNYIACARAAVIVHLLQLRDSTFTLEAYFPKGPRGFLEPSDAQKQLATQLCTSLVSVQAVSATHDSEYGKATWEFYCKSQSDWPSVLVSVPSTITADGFHVFYVDAIQAVLDYQINHVK